MKEKQEDVQLLHIKMLINVGLKDTITFFERGQLLGGPYNAQKVSGV